jgi:hypothetical protein
MVKRHMGERRMGERHMERDRERQTSTPSQGKRGQKRHIGEMHMEKQQLKHGREKHMVERDTWTETCKLLV